MAGSYKDLTAWQKGVALAKEMYHFTKSFPIEEIDGLTQMMRRTAVQVPCKIAAAHAIASQNLLHSNLCKAEMLLVELETQVEVACELDFCTPDQKSNILALILTEQRLVGNLLLKVGRKFR